MLVPENTAQLLSLVRYVDRIWPPGAEISGFMRPSRVEPQLLNSLILLMPFSIARAEPSLLSKTNSIVLPASSSSSSQMPSS